MAAGDRERWNRKGHHPHEPSARLVQWTQRLARPRALDLAAGRGANAEHLRRAGFTVFTVDVADVAKPDVLADLDFFGLKPGAVDTIVSARFLQRRLIPDWIAALRPGGTLFLEIPMRGINPAYCVRPGELRELTRGTTELCFDESGDLAAILVSR